MNAIAPSSLLKAALYADAAASGAAALLQLSAGSSLVGWFALPVGLVFGSAVFMVAYVPLLVVMARSQRLWSWLVLVIIAGNVGWALGCLGLLKLLPTAPSTLGVAFLLLQAAAVLMLAALEWTGWRASPQAGSPLCAVPS